MVFETLTGRKEGAVLFANIAAPPMNLLGPELVRDRIYSVQRTEGDDSVQVIVFTSADPDYFISLVDVTRINEYRHEAERLTGEPSIALLFRYLSASRLVTIAQIEGRVRGAGSAFVLACDMRFAARESAIFGQLELSFGTIPGGGGVQHFDASHGSRAGARGHVERRRLRRGVGRTIRLNQSNLTRRIACGFRELARAPDRQLSRGRACRGQGPGQCRRTRAGRGLSSRFGSLRRGSASTRSTKPDPSCNHARLPNARRGTRAGADVGQLGLTTSGR